MSASLSKSERICSVKAIDTLIARGRYISSGPLRCCFVGTGAGATAAAAENAGATENASSTEKAGLAEKPANQILVSVPKRLFKRAVKRNLLKRRIREAYRLQKELLGSCGVMMMFVYTSKEVADFEQIFSAMTQILSSINGRTAAK